MIASATMFGGMAFTAKVATARLAGPEVAVLRMGAGLLPCLLVGALSAVASGVAVTAIRAARRSENSWSVYASFCLLGMFVSMPLGIAQWVTPNRIEWLWITATAILAMGAQLLMTFSLRWVDAMTVGVISQLAVLVSMTLGVLILGDHLSLASALGSALCIGGVAGVTFVTSISKPVIAATEIVPEL